MEREKLVSLVTAAQQGKNDALNDLFNAFYDDVYYFALKILKDHDLACDITQEAFIEIINTIGNLHEPAAFVTWMKEITYHQCTRYFKKKKDVLVDEDEDGNSVFDTLTEDRAEFIPDEALDQDDFRKTILAMIDQLSEEQRAATMMFYFDEFSVKQIAQMQGVSEGTVKSRLNYARKSIKSSVEEYEKKNNIKLHSFGFLPLLLWLFRGSFAKAMPIGAAKSVAAGISATTGVGITVGGVATAAATTTAAAAATGLGVKLAAIPLTVKIIAGLTAAALVIGGGVTVAVSNFGGSTDEIPTEPQETIQVTEYEESGFDDAEPEETTDTTEPEATENETESATEPEATEDETESATEPEATEDETESATEPEATEEETEHSHSYAEEITLAPTCLNTGKATYTCTCGDSYTKKLDATGHNWTGWVVKEESTATDKGTAERSCQACNKQESKESPLLKTIESTVDNTINLSGSTFEAIVRQFTHDQVPDDYSYEYDVFYYSNIPSSTGINFLNLSSPYAYSSVFERTGGQGRLNSAFLEGTSPYAGSGAKEICLQTIEICNAMLGMSPNYFCVWDYTAEDEFGNLTGIEYNTIHEIPDDIWQKATNGQAEIDIGYYDMSNSYGGSSLSICGDRIMFGMHF